MHSGSGKSGTRHLLRIGFQGGMVQLDTANRDSLFIEDIVEKWCKKMGKMRIAQLFQKMYVNLSTAKRQRNMPTVQECYESIIVDENGK